MTVEPLLLTPASAESIDPVTDAAFQLEPREKVVAALIATGLNSVG
jgi:hypothetical protein